MITETMNIRTALKTRTLLDKRISDAINDITLAKAYCVDDPVLPGLLTPEQYEEKMKADYQSLNDLIKRREAIQSKILEVNAATKVTVPTFVSFTKVGDGEEEEISLAAAIARKNYYGGELSRATKTLIDTYNKNGKEIEAMKNKYEIKIRQMVSERFANQTNYSQATYDEYVKQLLEKYTVKVINPLDCTAVLQKIIKDIQDYVQDIDNKLSEKTETTYFDVSY